VAILVLLLVFDDIPRQLEGSTSTGFFVYTAYRLHIDHPTLEWQPKPTLLYYVCSSDLRDDSLCNSERNDSKIFKQGQEGAGLSDVNELLQHPFFTYA
jgi:hypothetical protein